MTPLAHRIVKELTLPIKKRTFRDNAGLLKLLDDVHCFECSDVIPLAQDAGSAAMKGDFDARTTFLPAPKTWIEFDDTSGRVGILLQQINDPDGKPVAASYRMALDGLGQFASWEKTGLLFLSGVGCHNTIGLPCDDDGRMTEALIYGFLACINTPRIIGRRQHMPHRGLERRLAAAKGVQGRFPLHAWTEIKLHVTKPVDLSGAPSVEAHLTGQRALHFVRAFLRVRLGRLELVGAHWRGDGSVGIKQSRYKLAA